MATVTCADTLRSTSISVPIAGNSTVMIAQAATRENTGSNRRIVRAA